MKYNQKKFIFCYTLLITLNFSFCNRRSKEEWKSRVIYQIVTDRFAKTDDDSLTDCDISKNTYCGGTFKGIQQNLDYISGMGFNAIWISPPLKNKENSFHGYHNIDLNSINEHFGSTTDLKDLIRECHKKDIWVILDAVPNHMAGELDISTFKPFNKQEHYHDNCDVDENSSQEEKENCRIWGMPDLKQENTFVEQTLLNWLDDMINTYNFDGIRYADVANVPKWFWREFTDTANEYTLGFISSDNVSYIADYQQYMDGVGDYPLFYSIRKSFCGSMLNLNDYYINSHKKYINPQYNGIFLGNHDNPRFLNGCNKRNLLRNAIIFTLFYEGIPIFYYGDEQYFDGGKDPLNREVMYGRHSTSSDAYQLIKKANDIRKKEKIYEENLIQVYANDYLYVFTRGKVLIVVSNVNEIERTLTEHNFNEGDTLCNNLKDGDCVTVVGGKINIKMEGEPKVYVLNNKNDDNNDDKKSYANILSTSIYLLFLTFILYLK